jgi:hypothetical protein
MIRGISAVIAMIREAMGEESGVSGRERIIKKSVLKEDNLKKKKKSRKAAVAKDVFKLVDESRRTDRRADWIVAAMAVVCYYGCRRHEDGQGGGRAVHGRGDQVLPEEAQDR